MLPFDLTDVLVPTVFFLFVGAVVIVPIWLSHRRRIETQKTLQLAIEKGQALDPKVVEKLLDSSGGGRSKENGPRGGVMTLFSGLGIAAFGFIAGGFDWGQYLMAVGALIGLVGAGRIVAGMTFPSKADNADPDSSGPTA